MVYNKYIKLEIFTVSRYKKSSEERLVERERKENLPNIMKGLDIKNFNDIQDVFKVMVGELLENGLEVELGYSKYDYRNKEYDNSRNGYSKKLLKLVSKKLKLKFHEIETGNLSHSLLRSIRQCLPEIYGLECSDTTISRIVDKVLPVVREWKSRLLEEIYAVVFMDAIHFHVRS